MGTNVFGHGDLSLPIVNPDHWSIGVDSRIRHASCRGESEPCDPYDTNPVCHDHACCCDECRHAEATMCNHGCCRCVPKYMCVVFTPDAGQESVFECGIKGWRLETDDNTDDLGPVAERMYYTGDVRGIGNNWTISVGAREAGDENLYYDCFWRFTFPDLGIDEVVEIDHRGLVNCLSFPDITVENVVITSGRSDGATFDCNGSITFSTYVNSKVPFSKKYMEIDEKQATQVACGSCNEVCTVLCVTQVLASDTANPIQSEYIKVTGEDKWINSDDEYQHFQLAELGLYPGNCYIELTSIGASALNQEYILVDPNDCAVGMVLSAVADNGDTIKIACNPCDRYSYICGTCRCVCETLCVIAVDSGVAEVYELPWNRDTLEWSDGTLSVQIGADENGNCIISSYGYEESASIDNACGGDLFFTLLDTPETLIEAGNARYMAGWCKRCSPCEAAGDCLTQCENVPQVVYAEVITEAEHPSAEIDYRIPCAPTYTVPLFLQYAGPSAAGEWRWIGYYVYTCDGDFGVGDDNGYLIKIDIGCDGSVNITTTDSDGLFCVTSTTISVPCFAPWDINIVDLQTCHPTPDSCCQNGWWQISITE